MKPENHTISKVRQFLKLQSEVIHVLKQLRKCEQNQHIGSVSPEAQAVIESYKKRPYYTADFFLAGLRNDARHYHIAWSEFFGKTREQIEAKSNKPPCEELIQSIKYALLSENIEFVERRERLLVENSHRAEDPRHA